MVEVDKSQRAARAREVRHVVVARLTAGIHRTFRWLLTARRMAAAQPTRKSASLSVILRPIPDTQTFSKQAAA